tara:strand:- start:357 stop:1151 length:795 start_codon:yes stop_codon:yes gene_type:complete
MKKLLFIIVLTLSWSQVKSQCSEEFTPNFVDFLDTNGYSHTLYEYLLSGKIVVADFYLLTCGSCMASAPCIEELYQNYGQNTGDVIVLAFDVGEGDSTDEVAIEWAEEYGMPNVPNFSQMGGEQDTEGFWGSFYFACGENGGFAQTYVVTGKFCCGDPNALNYESGCYAYCGDNTCCMYNETDTPMTQGISYVHQGGSINCSDIIDHIDNLLLEIVDLNEIDTYKTKKIINTINVFGQKVEKNTNTMLLNIYDNGTVEKVYVVK